MPDDVVKFLEEVFAKPLHTWNADPGYASRIISMCPPPSNSRILVRKKKNRDFSTLPDVFISISCTSLWFPQGPVPKFDPSFMVQALLAYSPHKHATGQPMTKWDHSVRLWMENLMATAYGVAPALSWPIHDIQTPYEYVMVRNAKNKLVPKLDKNDMPISNPHYEEDLLEFARALAPRFDELKNRQAFARRAAHGFNITFELMRRARNINFANEVKKLVKKGAGSAPEHLYSCYPSYNCSSAKEVRTDASASSKGTVSASTSLTTSTSWQ